MSRIGRMPIAIPAGVTVTLEEGNQITVKGKLGTLNRTYSKLLAVNVEGNEIHVTRSNEEDETKALHGLTRALIHDMVVGVSEGFSKKLEIVGVGYKVVKAGKSIKMFLGHSLLAGGEPQAAYVVAEPEGITFECPDANTILVKGYDKQAVGQVAAVLRAKRPPEPYHGKGVKYADEHIRRKAGKAGKSGK